MTSSSIGSYYTEYMQRARFCIIVFLYVVWENSSHRLPFSIALKLQYFTDDVPSHERIPLSIVFWKLTFRNKEAPYNETREDTEFFLLTALSSTVTCFLCLLRHRLYLHCLFLFALKYEKIHTQKSITFNLRYHTYSILKVIFRVI